MQHRYYDSPPPDTTGIPVPLDSFPPAQPPEWTHVPFGAWEPRPYSKGYRHRRGRRHRPFLAFACTILLLVGLTVALRVLTRSDGDRLLAPPQSSGSGFSLPDALSDQTPDTTIPRAPTGSGVILSLAPQEGRRSLSLQEIYQKNQAAIVCVRATSSSGVGEGTGVIMSQDGYIVTNAHVIQGCERVTITLGDDDALEALLVGYDLDTDLAVLKISSTNLTVAEFGDSDTLQVGDTALAIGNPLGARFRGTMTDGIISAINRDVVVDGVSRALIQTTAALNSGNSGGALINDLGQVVGITSMKMTSSYDTIEGLGFAIPTTTVKEVVDALIAEGHISGRPTIGITVTTLTADAGKEAKISQGVQVVHVEPKSDAHQKGLKAGDIIVEANGQPVVTSDGLNRIKSTLAVGDILSLSIYRGTDQKTIEVALVEKYTLE